MQRTMLQQEPKWTTKRDERMWEEMQKTARRSFKEKEERSAKRTVRIGLAVIYIALAGMLAFVVYLIYTNAQRLTEALDAPQGTPANDEATWYIMQVAFWALWAGYLLWKIWRIARKNKE